MLLSSCDVPDVSLEELILMERGQGIVTISDCMPSFINDSIAFTT